MSYEVPCRNCGKPAPCLVDPEEFHVDGAYCSPECREAFREKVMMDRPVAYADRLHGHTADLAVMLAPRKDEEVRYEVIKARVGKPHRLVFDPSVVGADVEATAAKPADSLTFKIKVPADD